MRVTEQVFLREIVASAKKSRLMSLIELVSSFYRSEAVLAILLWRQRKLPQGMGLSCSHYDANEHVLAWNKTAKLIDQSPADAARATRTCVCKLYYFWQLFII